MIFNSLEFLVFFPVVTLLYFLLPHKFRWVLLLISSCIFYAFFKWEYLLILFFTIVVDYYAGIWIEQTKGRHRKIALLISIVANVGVLAFFKYYYFILDNFNKVSFRINGDTYDPMWQFILPIGLSFHTFQAMSYTIEVYRGVQKAERKFGIYALYVMFYPQLVAGPIERPQNILHQFYEKFDFNKERVVSGLRLMLWGFFKKIAISDNLSVFSDEVFANVGHYQGLPLFVAIFFYSIQIYCDFSGYSDIAIGASRVMGFKLMKNFDRPYMAKTITEFWRRWHISLSTWFKDYVYIPLGGNKVKVARKYLNLMLVFFLSGLWHGASWNFVIWGGIHGIYQIFGQITKGFQAKLFAPMGKLGDIIQNIITVSLVMFAWIFFRAQNFEDAKLFISGLFKKSTHSVSMLVQIISWDKIIAIVLAVLVLEIVQKMQDRINVGKWVDEKPLWQRWSIYLGLIYFILLFGYFGSNQFIYFQF